MNGIVRLDLMTLGQRERLARELARIPPALDGRTRYGLTDDDPTPTWRLARELRG